MKTFSVVDARTGFVLNSKIYAGKGSEELKFSMKEYGYGGTILLELVEPYFSKNHVIFADNYFTSPAAAKILLSKSTYICGTVRCNRKNLPKISQQKKGDVIAFHSEGANGGILLGSWKDRRQVKMISTGMKHEMMEVTTRSGAIKRKAMTVVEYNKLARGIDLSDMQIHQYDTNRRSYKWYKKMFMRLVDLALYNALIMMREHHQKHSFLDFRLNLVRQLLEITGGTTSAKPLPQNEIPFRLTERHFIAKCIRTGSDKSSYRRCQVCAKEKKEKRTSYCCPKCEVALCVVPCFEIYHTKRNL
ncbi:piggyBac transposable element-derived protein 4 [Folsomia candida]|uniref:piggyBac transposable element-derived protein 4 n=1 Tax=Folsomia candida TaxID=158441 RepID=UPI000B900A26|nr:piggyBac transposable element-derived protein 4 [Folsomia candida]